MPNDSDGLRERVLSQIQQTVQVLAGEICSIGPGWFVRTDDLPQVWTLNQLHITHPTTVADVGALADEHQAHLPYRHVVVDDGATGHELEHALSVIGWKVDRQVLMVLGAKPNREVDTKDVVELGENVMLALMRRWLTEENLDITASGLTQMEEYNRREGRLWNERCFGVLNDSGLPTAITKLRSDGSTAWVEDVYTTPEERGRGFGRMLVTYATQLSRSAKHDLTFIVADDNDWPKHLYAEIGFRAIGRRWTFHRAA